MATAKWRLRLNGVYMSSEEYKRQSDKAYFFNKKTDKIKF